MWMSTNPEIAQKSLLQRRAHEDFVPALRVSEFWLINNIVNMNGVCEVEGEVFVSRDCKSLLMDGIISEVCG